MAHELSAGRSLCILAIVVGCFAILLPNIFYPMLKSSILGSVDELSGCCDVLLYNDVNGVKLVSELCNSVLKLSENYGVRSNLPLYHLSKDDIKHCRTVVFDTCEVDIHNLLKDKIQLNLVYKKTLEDLRTFNKSLCLKYHFDVTLDLLGASRWVKKFNTNHTPIHHRQERFPYSRSNALHPALRERGRAVPQPQTTSRIQRERGSPPIPVISAKKPPIPGMRPPIGGAGHIQTQKGTGPMGILMPLYTVGIVIFFGYTITKLICKKSDNSGNHIEHDPEFCRLVFNNNASESKSRSNEKSINSSTDVSSKLVVSAISSLLQEVNRDILERTNNVKDQDYVFQPNENSNSVSKNLTEQIVDHTDIKSSSDEPEEKVESMTELLETNNSSEIEEKVNGKIEVVGMELNESCENGRPWTCSARSENKIISPSEIIPQEIILAANVPVNSQILVSDAHTENITAESSVILESKVTLNVISPELNNQAICETKKRVKDDEVDLDDNKCENITPKSELHAPNGRIKNEIISKESDEDENCTSRNGTEFVNDELNTEL